MEKKNLTSLLAELAKAKEEIDFANRQFEEVSDAAAVDEVIYRLAAAERKFDRLLQIAKDSEVTHDELKKIGVRWEAFYPAKRAL